MSSFNVLEAVSTASGSVRSGRDVTYGVKRAQSWQSASATQLDGTKLVTSVASPATTVIDRLLREEARAALSGTISSGAPLLLWPLYAILYDLLTTGIGHGTQYLWKIEPESLPRPSKIHSKSPNAEDLTRRALALSGLTRDQLATAMGVQRQSVHNWLGARGMSPDNQRKQRELITLFKQARRRFGNAQQVSQWFTTPVREDGPSPLEMLKTPGIGAVKGRLLRGTPTGGVALSPAASSRGVPRRAGPVGYHLPWTSPSHSPRFDPEEGGESAVTGSVEESYRDARPLRVTGLARA